MSTRRGRLGTAVAGSVLAAALLAACADEPGDPTPTSPTPPTSPTLPDPTVGPGPTVPPSPGSPSPSPPPLTVEATFTGRVVAGVEAGCKLLETDRDAYLLTGEIARELEVGATVTVRGEVRPDLMSTCQQGTPLEVTEVLD